ncbi:MAG: WD40 repeat domain-containing protein [Chitinophagales bacterium]|nr:WD40 repeat domain-containing protein [Chitinophagales bacterium]
MEARQFKLFKELRGHSGSVYSINTDDTQFFYSVGGDGWIVQWDLSGTKSDGILVAKTDAKLFSTCLLWDKNTLLAGDMNGLLFWFDIDKKEMQAVVKGHQSSIFDILQISDQVLVTASKDGYLCFWNIANRHPIHSYKINHKGLRCIEANTQLDTLFIGGSDHHVYEFSLKTNTVVDTIDDAHENSVFTILNLDDEALITGGRDAMMKEWQTTHPAKLLQALPAHWYTINSIVDMPDTGLIASGSRDKTIRVWDRETLQAIQKIDVQKGGHINSVNKLQWSDKYQSLISASDDRTIRIWRMEL